MKKFILGLATGILILPLAEGLLELILTWVEVAKIAPLKKIQKYNTESPESEEKQDTYCIGFQVPNEEEYEDDDF